MTRVKDSLQVSYDLDHSNTVTCEFIANRLVEEAASLGEHNSQGVGDVNTRDNKVPESGVKRAHGAIFNEFYPNW